jgi:hypothetical protein
MDTLILVFNRTLYLLIIQSVHGENSSHEFFFHFLNTFTNLTGQCVKTMENFFEFLQITFPRECNQTQRPSFDSMRKYMVCTSILSVTIKNEIYES